MSHEHADQQRSSACGAHPSPARYADLAGRSIFVTGGATGIGAALVGNFAAQGARVHFVDLDEAAGVALAAALNAGGHGHTSFVHCDVTDTAELDEAIGAAHAEAGDLYALVNNAANDRRHDVGQLTPQEWDEIVAVNVKHQFFAAKRAYPLIAASGGGAIINFGSIAPTLGIENLAVYSTCKAGVFGLTRALAREYGPNGVRVNAVVPGAILTERQLALWISTEDEAAIIERQCLKRRMVEQDIAEMVLFLASAASSGCTGQEFKVDGGHF